MRTFVTACPIGQCGVATGGKPYCPKHMDVKERRKLSSSLRSLIRSDCCEAACTQGDLHEFGEQYCTKCKKPCCWKTVMSRV